MKITERTNFRVEFKGTVRVVDLPSGGGAFLAVADLVTVAGSIDPRRLGDLGYVSMSDSMASNDIDGDYERRCREIVQLLREQFGSGIKAEVTWDETETCSHCGYSWEQLTAEDIAQYPDVIGPDDVVGLPQCCEQAQAEWRAAQAEVTA